MTKEIIYYELDTLADFDKNVERFIKKKRFKSLQGQIDELVEPLSRGEFPGDLIRHGEEPEPYDIYKLRLPNPDTNAGKSNGYRLIYIVITDRKLIVLMTIYYKKEQETITDMYVWGLIDGFFLTDNE